METLLECKELSKHFEDNKAVDRVSFKVKKGELYGLIGPDGAGKTTLMRLITSLMLPDEGSVTFEGRDAVKDYRYLRQHIGYSPGRFSLYQDLSIQENLEFFSGVFGTTLEKSYHLIEPVYKMLEPFKDRKAGALSGGMKQKLSLCCALVHVPKLLVLDEPTTGVDAVSRKEFWELLGDLRQRGITTLVSTPYMDEAGLCDRVSLMQSGRVLVTNRPDNIEQQYAYPIYGIRTRKIPEMLEFLRAQEITHSAYPFGTQIHWSGLKDKSYESLFVDLTKVDPIAEVVEIKANIEDCFMDLMTQEHAHH